MDLQSPLHDTDVLIIGGGPAGLSAAYTCQSLGVSHLLLEATDKLGGQLSWTESRLRGLMGWSTQRPQDVLRHFLESVKNADCSILMNARVIQLYPTDSNRTAVVLGEDGAMRQIRFKKLILAAGAAERKLSVDGEHLPHVYGAGFSASRHASQFAHKRVMVVGGGDRALEGAIYCADEGAQVIVVHRRSAFRGRPEFHDRVLSHPHIRVCTDTAVKSFHDHSDGHPHRVRVLLSSTLEGKEYDEIVDAVLVRIGMQPKTDLLHSFVAVKEDGTIDTDKFSQTSLPGIYAVGDAVTPAWGCSIATAVGDGAKAARHAAATL